MHLRFFHISISHSFYVSSIHRQLWFLILDSWILNQELILQLVEQVGHFSLMEFYFILTDSIYSACEVLAEWGQNHRTIYYMYIHIMNFEV